MKSLLVWGLATLIGLALGFGISWLTEFNLYLSMGIGAILGSSAGVTANMHRERKIAKSVIESENNTNVTETDIATEESDNSTNTKQKVS